MTLYHFLILSSLLFSIGLYGVLSRRNILSILMSIELMFNAATINFVAFNYYRYPGQVWGMGFAIFVITLAAAEAVVGLSLILAGTRNFRTSPDAPTATSHG